MTLDLVRDPPTPQSTPGRLAVDGVFQCWTLEPPPPVSIPPGRYSVALRWSPHFGRVVPHVDAVPGRTAILIHPGNDAHDTQGCILVGATHRDDWVGEPWPAFLALMARLDHQADAIGLTVTAA